MHNRSGTAGVCLLTDHGDHLAETAMKIKVLLIALQMRQIRIIPLL
jgi:hypothetical protein